jgi:hypothetical protein
MDPAAPSGDFEPGIFIRRSWWYIMVIPGGTRWLTTARAVSAPLALKASIQSLSSNPARGRRFR